MNDKKIKIERMYLLGVPIDVIPPEQLRDIVHKLLTIEKPSQIIFIRWWDIIRAIFKAEYKAMLRHAGLVVPTVPSIVIGARILRNKRVARYNPFSFIIKLLAILESYNSTLYLIGMDLRSIQEVENNIGKTYPKLRIVGRHPGYFSTLQEKSVVIAIRKSAPTLLLAGSGLYRHDAWLYKIKHNVKCNLMASSRTVFNILANKSRRPSTIVARSGLGCVPQFIKSPWRLYRFPIFITYFLALIYCRLFRRY